MFRFMVALLVSVGSARSAGFNPSSYEEYRSATVSTTVFATIHSIVYTNWLPVENPTNAVVTNISFLANIYPTNFAGSGGTATSVIENTWSVTLHGTGGWETVSFTTRTNLTQTNLVLNSGGAVRGYEFCLAAQERVEAIGSTNSRAPRLFRQNYETLVEAKAWIAGHASYFVDTSLADTNGSFDSWLSASSWHWNGITTFLNQVQSPLFPGSSHRLRSGWELRPSYPVDIPGTEYDTPMPTEVFVGEYNYPFPVLSTRRLLQICNLPFAYSTQVVTNQDLYGFQVGHLDSFLPKSNTIHTVTNIVTSWFDFTPRRAPHLPPATHSYSNNYTVEIVINETTALDWGQKATIGAPCEDIDFGCGEPWSCWAKDLWTTCKDHETNWLSYTLWKYTNTTPVSFGLEIFRYGASDFLTNLCAETYVDLSLLTPVYSNTFPNATRFVWTNSCIFIDIAPGYDDVDYGWGGVTACLSKMVWTWEGAPAWNSQLVHGQLPSTNFFTEASTNNLAGNVITTNTDETLPVAVYTNGVAVTNVPSRLGEYDPDETVALNANPRSVFEWNLTYRIAEGYYDDGFGSVWDHRSGGYPSYAQGSNWFSRLLEDPPGGSLRHHYVTGTATATNLPWGPEAFVDLYLGALPTLPAAGFIGTTNYYAYDASSPFQFGFWRLVLSNATIECSLGVTNNFWDPREEQYGIEWIAPTNLPHSPGLVRAGTTNKPAGTNRIAFMPNGWQPAAPELRLLVDSNYVYSIWPATCDTNEPQIANHVMSTKAGAWGYVLNTHPMLLKWDGTNGFRFR